jgi:hypothetical protein
MDTRNREIKPHAMKRMLKYMKVRILQEGK